MSANWFTSFILVLIANTVLAGLLPRIQDENVQLEPTDKNKYSYTLRIIHPDSAVREETVEEVAPGELEVKGVFTQDFGDVSDPKDNSNPEIFSRVLVVTYESGINGYIAKYSYVLKPRETPTLSLSPNLLKATLG
ncbi:uncharacterized protein LOC117787370 [Drosophila innubila]|uniref:uncharacterized protein LOC117787370 n=1 Tax=Drosophila innubila TaxID=198719 RepID=UPI00148BC0D0|nr:uncharacterized protein LOC117787370 [Drosophila innubila]